MASYLDPVTTLSGVEDPFAARMRRDFLESAFDLAATPTPVPVQQIAGLDPLQQQARQLAGGLGQFQPFIQQAAGFYGPQGARDFYNPYEDAVVQQTISDLTERSGIQGIADRASAVQAGAFGGSRGRLMESERQRALGRGLTEAIGGIRQRGFEGARAAAQGAASGLAGLAQTGQAGLINQIGTLGQLGGLGRGIQQAGFDATFGAAQRAALEPRQRLQTLQGMLSLLPRTQASTVFRAAAGTDPTAQALGLLRGGGLGGILGFEEGTGPEGVPQIPEGKKFAGLRALAKERPDVVKKMGYEQGGEVFPADEAYNFVGGTGPEGVPYPVKMQEGGITPEVFEEGDDEINNALNKMLDMTRGVGGTETPMVDMPEVDIETARVKSPGGSQQEFISLVKEKEGNLQDAIKIFLTEKTEDDSPAAQIQQEIQTFVDKAEGRYKKEVADAALKLNIDINTDQVTLITDEFDKEIESMFPKLASMLDGEATQEVAMMEEGGEVEANVKINELQAQITQLETEKAALSPSARKQRADIQKKINSLKKQIRELQKPAKTEVEGQAAKRGRTDETKDTGDKGDGDKGDGDDDASDDDGDDDDGGPTVTTRTTQDIISPYLQNLREGARRIGDAALLSGTSKEGGLGGTLGILGKSKLAEEKALSTGDLAAINVLGRGAGGADQMRRDAAIASLAQKDLENAGILPVDDKGLPNPTFERILKEVITAYNRQLGA
tara:strand:+ start:273 stop:2450 length:2178 start_codon:yes stop_codon:yes gene_type:complete